MIDTLSLQKTYSFGLKWSLGWLLTNWHYTFGIYSRKSRSLVYTMADYLGLHNLGRRRPELPLTRWNRYVHSLSCSIVEPEAKDGNVNLFELMVLCSLVKNMNCTNVFEIGTFNGRTALNFALNVPPGGEVHTLDLPCEAINEAAGTLDYGDLFYVKSHKPGELIDRSDLPEKNYINRLLGDSASFDYSPYVNRMDLVFIDGAHHYDYVRRDTDTAFRLLRNGKGTIVWHDYDGYVGVTDFLDDFRRQHPRHNNMEHIEGTTLAILTVT